MCIWVSVARSVFCSVQFLSIFMTVRGDLTLDGPILIIWLGSQICSFLALVLKWRLDLNRYVKKLELRSWAMSSWIVSCYLNNSVNSITPTFDGAKVRLFLDETNLLQQNQPESVHLLWWLYIISAALNRWNLYHLSLCLINCWL